VNLVNIHTKQVSEWVSVMLGEEECDVCDIDNPLIEIFVMLA